MSYRVHTPETAAESAKNVLDTAKDKYGFIPNLLGVMSEAPQLAKAYVAVSGLFDDTSFDATERQVVLLTASREHGCEYCVAAHSAIAAMQDVPDHVVGAIRDENSIDDERLEALRNFTLAVIQTRGWPGDSDTEAFFDAGYGKQQVLEVILGIALKTMSNYTNHIAETPLDDAFEQTRWQCAA